MTDESLFIAALEKSTPTERVEFLDRACGGDAALRGRLDRLLAGHDRATGILDHSAVSPNPDGPADRGRPPAERAGAVLAGRYELLEEIGEGGMGTVWAAEQFHPVRRTVAVKLVKAGMDSRSVLARFGAERQALAVMDHPHIAKVLDGGTTDAGRPFFVMEYVRGVPLTAYCDDARLSVADRLALFVPVCQAVQHAHQKGIVHRDLKPSNVLVCLSDGKPVPKVIDFGLAKALHQPLTEHTLHTAHGQMLGTPLYMSPEQAESDNPDVDTRADVYALGVILYELLTGTTPLERDRFRRAAWDETLRLIREEEPPRPSARLSGSGTLSGVAARRRLEPGRLTKLVRGELDWIVMKCLEKDRGRRYDTANGLARDVQRYLDDEPVEACPPSAAYRFRKAARKYRIPLATAAVVTGLLAAGVVVLAVALAAVDQERRAKEAALDAKETAFQAEGKRRKQTRAALDAMSSQVIEDWLASQPALVPHHKQFLEQALGQYEEFAADTGEDEEARAGVAHAYFQVGSIRGRLGEWKAAEAAWDRSRALFAALPDRPARRVMLARTLNRLGALYRVTDRPRQAVAALEECRDAYRSLAAADTAETDYQVGLGNALDQLGETLQKINRPADAGAAFAEAVPLLRRLIDASPTDPRPRYHLARVLMHSGLLHQLARRPREAEDSHRQAVDHYTRLAAEHPTPRFTEALAMGRNNLARVLQAAGPGSYPEAERNFRGAVAARRRLVADFPAVPDYRRGLAIAVNNLGILLKNTDREAGAEECYAEAADIHKKLADDFPAVSAHQNEAAGARTNLGRLLLLRKDFAGARRLLDEAARYHQAALKGNPDDPEYRQFYRNNRWRLAETCLGLKDHAAASSAVDEFLRYATEPPRNSYTAATLFAGCVRLATQDERLTEAQRRESAAGYADRATGALRRAVELNAKEAERPDTDASLAPLRGRPDFERLLAELSGRDTSRPPGR